MAARDTKHTPPWHAIGAEEALRRLGSDAEKGLVESEAARRLASYGPNRLPEGAKRGPLRRNCLGVENVIDSKKLECA
jgi:magnesium-transporting ATPase (P-type)